MARKHRRSWTPIRDGEPHPAAGYRASIAKLESDRLDRLGGLLAMMVDLATGGLGGLGVARYRVLVCREGTENCVGVREARTLRHATGQLADVDRVLARSTEDEARTALGLDV